MDSTEMAWYMVLEIEDDLLSVVNQTGKKARILRGNPILWYGICAIPVRIKVDPFHQHLT